MASGSVKAKAVKRAAQTPSVEVDMNRIYAIESSNNPRAHNKRTNARGLGQITPIVVDEWNNFNPDTPITTDSLWNAGLNQQVASWYMNDRIPKMLRAYGIPDTIDNRLAAYNAGIGIVKANRGLPSETQNYIRKYKEMQ